MLVEVKDPIQIILWCLDSMPTQIVAVEEVVVDHHQHQVDLVDLDLFLLPIQPK